MLISGAKKRGSPVSNRSSPKARPIAVYPRSTGIVARKARGKVLLVSTGG